MLTIVWYSLFTFLSAFVTGVWQLAILRLLAGVGIGGEWAMGGTFVAEEWPESRRRVGAGLMHTGYYVGIFLAALANYGIGSHYGWRAMFIVGGLPALLLAWIRHGVTEPAAWKKKESVVRSWAVWRPFATLFSAAFRGRTIVNALLMLVSIGGLWAGTVYVPAATTALAEAGGRVGPQAAQLASWAIMLVSFATILGCLAMPRLAEAVGRRGALAVFFTLMMVFIALYFRQDFLSRAQRAPLVFRLPLLPGLGRRQLRRLHPLAARAISHRVPRQRLRLFHVVRPIWRRRNHFPGWGGRASLRLAWNSCGHDFHRFCSWPPFDSVVRGDTGQHTAYVAHVSCN